MKHTHTHIQSWKKSYPKTAPVVIQLRSPWDEVVSQILTSEQGQLASRLQDQCESSILTQTPIHTHPRHINCQDHILIILLSYHGLLGSCMHRLLVPLRPRPQLLGGRPQRRGWRRGTRKVQAAGAGSMRRVTGKCLLGCG